MAEMADAGENHRQIQPVCRCYDFFVADRSAGLDDRRGSVPGCFFHTVREREESVRAYYRACQRQDRLGGSNPYCVHTAHLARAYAYRLPWARVHNRVGLDVLGDLPG